MITSLTCPAIVLTHYLITSPTPLFLFFFFLHCCYYYMRPSIFVFFSTREFPIVFVCVNNAKLICSCIVGQRKYIGTANNITRSPACFSELRGERRQFQVTRISTQVWSRILINTFFSSF